MVGDQRPFETLLKGKANWQGAGGKVRNNWQGDHGVSVISNFLRLDRVETRPQSQITISGIKRSNSLFIKFVDFGISSCNLYFRFKQMNRSEGSLEHAKLAQASKGFRRVRVVKLWAVLKAHFKIGNPDFPHQSFPNCLGVGSFTRRLPPPPPHGMSGDIFTCHQSGGEFYWHLVGSATQYPAMHGLAPTTKNCLVQNRNHFALLCFTEPLSTAWEQSDTWNLSRFFLLGT